MGQTKPPSRNIIGARVQEARRRRSPPLTQDQLSGKLAAQGLQLDRVTIGKIENGFRCALDFEVKALASVLGVDANWLLGTETAMRPQKRRGSSNRKSDE